METIDQTQGSGLFSLQMSFKCLTLGFMNQSFKAQQSGIHWTERKEWEYSTNHISNKGLISRTYKEHRELNNRQMNQWKRKSTSFPGEVRQMTKAKERLPSITNHGRNSDRNTLRGCFNHTALWGPWCLSQSYWLKDLACWHSELQRATWDSSSWVQHLELLKIKDADTCKL